MQIVQLRKKKKREEICCKKKGSIYLDCDAGHEQFYINLEQWVSSYKCEDVCTLQWNNSPNKLKWITSMAHW